MDELQELHDKKLRQYARLLWHLRGVELDKETRQELTLKANELMEEIEILKQAMGILEDEV